MSRRKKTRIAEASRSARSTGVPSLTALQLSSACPTWLKKVWLQWGRPHRAFLIVFALTCLWNFTLWRHSEPNVFPDAWEYWNLSNALRQGDWSHPSFSFRTPGFPAFLALVMSVAGDKNWEAVITCQFLIGSFIPLGLYALFLPIARNNTVAALGSASFLLDRYFLALQAVPLTEFLGGALCVFILAWYVWAWRRQVFWESVLLGFATGAWVLVRASFQLLPWLLILFAVVSSWIDLPAERKAERRRAVLWCILFWVGWQIPVFLWSGHVHSFTGHWGISHQLGASLTNHTGAFMELAPDKYGVLKDRYVEEKRRRGGNWINVFDAIDDELLSATGMKKWELSLAYKELDKELIRENWRSYFEQVKIAWEMLWKESSRYIVDWKAVELADPDALPPLTSILLYIRSHPLWHIGYRALDRWFWNNPEVAGYTPRLLLALSCLWLFGLRNKGHGMLAMLCIVGTIFYHMGVHAAVQFTEFGRYRLPVQPLWWSFLWFSAINFLWWISTKVRQLL